MQLAAAHNEDCDQLVHSTGEQLDDIHLKHILTMAVLKSGKKL
jgi:hypothetical protein